MYLVSCNCNECHTDQRERDDLSRSFVVLQEEQLGCRPHESDQQDDQQHSTNDIERLTHSDIVAYGHMCMMLATKTSQIDYSTNTRTFLGVT